MPKSSSGIRSPAYSLALVLLAVGAHWNSLQARPSLPASTSSAIPEKGTPRRLTLEEAKQLALANNKSLALARLNIDEKQHAANAARKDYFPKLLGNVTYFHFNDNLGEVVTVERGRRGILPPGTRTISANVLNQDTALSTVLVAQPITKLIAVCAAVKVARADQQAAQAQLDKGSRDVLSGVVQAYHGLLGTWRIEAALDLQIGLLEQVAAAKPSPELRIALVEARQGRLQVRAQVRELTDLMNDLLDLPRCTRLELVDPLPAGLPVRCAEDAAQLALTCSPEVREAEQQIAKAEAGHQVARMDYLPDVNVIGGYANQTGASYIQPNIGYLGVTANYTFWDWCKRKDVRRQRETQIALAHQNLQVASDKVQLEARKAYGTFEKAREGFALAGEMQQAREDVEKVATGAAAAQAKAETSRAKLEYMKAEIGYRVAHAQLTAILGKD